MAVSVAACFAFHGATSLANPSGPSVAFGNLNIGGLGSANLTIQNLGGTNAIINWNGFSIGINEITRFQQFSGLAVLNRVTGNEISSILGQLKSDGRVFLINPNGIVFGANARIDVAGLVASSLALSDQDFLNGTMRFTAVPNAGGVANHGVIETPAGGRVFLVAPDVQNTGIIRAPQGEIVLAAGKSAELVSESSPYVTVMVNADAQQALNVGSLIADSGRIGMFGALVRNSGVAEAGGAVAGPGGSIRFVATKDLTIDAGSRVAANGTTGGDVLLQAKEGTNLIAGTVEATGSTGKGGTVKALGVRVGVIGDGVIDASGETGGGTVLVGGDFQGKNPDVQNAERTFVGENAVIRADARDSGDGGRIIVWADGDTRFYGNASARGGDNGGDGGFVEVSGKQSLTFRGTVDTRAPKGKIGTLLLDPLDIFIYGGTADGNDDNVSSTSFDNFSYGQEPGTIYESELEGQAAFSSVIVSATNSITIQAMSDGELFLSYGGFFSAGAGGISMVPTDTIRTAGGALSFNATGSITLGHLNTGFGSVWNSYTGVSINGGSVSTGNILTGSATSFYGTNVSISGFAFNGFVSTGAIQTGSGGGSTGVNISSTGNTAGTVSTGAITTGASTSGDSAVFISATGNVSTGAITTGNAFFGTSAIDIDSGGNVTTGALTTGMSLDGCGDGCEGESYVFIAANGNVTTGNISTGATGASGFEAGDSGVEIGGANITTGNITTGNSFGDDGGSAVTSVNLAANGTIVTGAISTGSISHVIFGDSHDSGVRIESINGGNITTGSIATGSVDGAEAGGSSAVQISSNFSYGGRVMTGNIMTGSVFSNSGSSTSSYVSIESGSGGIQTGNVITGGNTLSGCCGSGDTTVFMQTNGSIVAGNITTGTIDGTEGGYTMAMLFAGGSMSAGSITTGNAGSTSSSFGLSGVTIQAANGSVTTGGITVGFGPDGGEAMIFAAAGIGIAGSIFTQGGPNGFVQINAGFSGAGDVFVAGAIVTRGTQAGQGGGQVMVQTGDGYGGGIGNIKIAGTIDTSGAAGAAGGGAGGYGGGVFIKSGVDGTIVIGPTPQFGTSVVAINTSGGAGGAGSPGQPGGAGGGAGPIIIDPASIVINGKLLGTGGAGGAGGAGAAGGPGGAGALVDLFAGAGGTPTIVELQLALSEFSSAASPGTVMFVNGPANQAELLAALAGGAGGAGTSAGAAGTAGELTVSGSLLAFVTLIDPLSIPAVLQAVGTTIEETQDAANTGQEDSAESEEDRRKKSFASCRPATT